VVDVHASERESQRRPELPEDIEQRHGIGAAGDGEHESGSMIPVGEQALCVRRCESDVLSNGANISHNSLPTIAKWM
jgi:hypothetical protein